ncbi:MAG: hypothetical protein ACP5UB_11340 [Candidatus Sumerlaeaceae bacterium]
MGFFIEGCDLVGAWGFPMLLVVEVARLGDQTWPRRLGTKASRVGANGRPCTTSHGVTLWGQKFSYASELSADHASFRPGLSTLSAELRAV